MRRLWVPVLIAGALGVISSGRAFASAPEVSVTAVPVQYGFVDGDSEKFRSHHWLNDRYVGGIKDFSFHDDDLVNDLSVTMKGRALIDQNDLAGFVDLKKKDVGFITLDYREFRSYYDETGGVYRPFTTVRVNELDRELALDIGHIAVETGLTLPDLPAFSLFYEREFKEGVKSRLTWTAVREGAPVRNIGPSPQEIDEISDTFGVRGHYDIKGFNLKGEQKWELTRAEMTRFERNIATTATASDRKQRVQTQDPESVLMTSMLEVDRWFLDERAHAMGAYRFAHLNNWEAENIFEMNEGGSLFNFTNPKAIRDARAHNGYDSHTWVGSFMGVPASWLTVITRLKSELFEREGNSTYPQDTTLGVPDGVINTTEDSHTNSRASRWGETISLRSTVIPRTTLYNDLDFEQVNSWLSEDRKSLAGQSAPNAGEIFSRETLTQSLRGIWTLGGRFVPYRWVDFTAQVRHRQSNNDYDDKRETDPTGSTSLSAFVDWQNLSADEFTTRVTLRPYRWIQPGARYQYRTDRYKTRFEAEPTHVLADMSSHIYTLDVTLRPCPKFTSLVSYSRQVAGIKTPAQFPSEAFKMYAFRADLDSWQVTGEYAVKPELLLTSGLFLSRAANFNDFTDIGLPLGSAYHQLDLSAGVKWFVKEKMFVAPQYGFYHYKTNPDAEFGGYNGHFIWVEIGFA